MTGGADARVTLRVVDPDGRAVAGAHVSGCFYNNGREGRDAEGETDARGEFVLSGRCSGDLNFRVNKAGWYETALRYWCYKPGFDCVKDGRWQPWDPVLEITLKEQRKPIPMYARRVESGMPTNGVPVGFDFMACDWVAPYGKGVSPDMLLTYTATHGTNTWRRHDFSITFTNGCDGAYVQRKDSFSGFASGYEAADSGYQSSLSYVYERTADKIIRERRLTADEVLVFRVRSRVDAKGNVVEANYGKIYGEFSFAQGHKKFVSFSYYFNPTPNDRNLEFDGKTNLFRPRWSDDDWPHEP